MYKPNQRQKALSRENAKIRVLAIERMLLEGSRLTSTEIQRRLDLHYDIQVDRKTIYADLSAIDRFIPLEVTGGKYGGFKKCDF